jgi:hypothetical protein
MSFNRIVLTGLTALAGLGIASEANAGGRNPGSLLLYPEFDNRNATVTVLTVTNTNDDFTPSASNPLVAAGTVRVEFKYIGKYDANENEINCEEFNREELLTPNDTLTLLTNAHNPQHEQGYVYVFAKNVAGQKIAFNHLIGNVLTIRGMFSFEYSVNPVAFDGIGDGTLTDLDGDGNCDLDGVEYGEVPDQILIPRFLGQSQGGFNSELILVALSGGAAFSTTVDFLIYNDNEEVFSSEYTFDCWDRVNLLSISGIFAQSFLAMFTNNAPLEVLGTGGAIESGWMRMDGGIADSTVVSIDDPAFYAVLLEKIGDNRGASDLPFEQGLQANGDLLPRSIFGDA